MDIREAYAILELPVGASRAEIEASYKRLVRVWHPDRFSQTSDLHAWAEEKLKRINAAYEILDDLLTCDSSSQPNTGTSPPPSSTAGHSPNADTWSWSERAKSAGPREVRPTAPSRAGVWAICAVLFIGFLGLLASATTPNHSGSAGYGNPGYAAAPQSPLAGDWVTPLGDVLRFTPTNDRDLQVSLAYGASVSACSGSVTEGAAGWYGGANFVHSADPSRTPRYAPLQVRMTSNSEADVDTEYVQWNGRRETARGAVTLKLRRL